MRKLADIYKKNLVTSIVITLIVATLPACDKISSEHIEAITQDKYPVADVANMLDDPLRALLKFNNFKEIPC